MTHLDSRLLGLAACALGLTLTTTAHAKPPVVVKSCSAPVVGAPGQKIIVAKDVTCTPGDVAAWGGASTFLSVGPGGELQLADKSITLVPNPMGPAITAVSLRGASRVKTSSDAPPTISGFARALHVTGAGNVIEDLVVSNGFLLPIAIGSGGTTAAAAIVVENGIANLLHDIELTGNYADVHADVVAGVLVWGDAPNASVGNTLRHITLEGNALTGLEGATPAPLPAPGQSPAAPPGPPGISDPTPGGAGIGQTLTTALMLWGTAEGTSYGHNLDDITITGNLVTTRTETRAALAGLLSLEGTQATTIAGVDVQGNLVTSVAGSAAVALEAQAGAVSLTESSMNALSNISVVGNAIAANRAAAGTVIAVGRKNLLNNVSVLGNSFQAGSFTGGLFLFGELSPEERSTGGNIVDGVVVANNFMQGFAGNAGVFLVAALANNLTHVAVQGNTYVPFGLDVFDLGLFGTIDCSPVPFSPFFYPYPSPPLNYWDDVTAITAAPACVTQ